jgi:hypothetical protein
VFRNRTFELTARLAVLLGLAIQFSKNELLYFFIIRTASAFPLRDSFFLSTLRFAVEQLLFSQPLIRCFSFFSAAVSLSGSVRRREAVSTSTA